MTNTRKEKQVISSHYFFFKFTNNARKFFIENDNFTRILEKYNNWQGTGQNVARDIAKGEEGKFDAHKLIGHWFNQILFFDPEGVKSFGQA